MIYLSSFALSDKKMKNPNLYPYSVFQDKDCDPFVFAPITILYGDNGCGKSTLLNIIAQIKKIQQEEALEQGYVYEQVRRKGLRKDVAQEMFRSTNGRSWSTMQILKFAQEKYSNGETAMQMLTDILEPDNLYLLDEPEVSLSPQNQVKLAEEINQCARFLGCQFIIATHSPFMLGTLQAKIYNLESTEVEEAKWYELKNVRYFYEFFDKNRKYFVR